MRHTCIGGIIRNKTSENWLSNPVLGDLPQFMTIKLVDGTGYPIFQTHGSVSRGLLTSATRLCAQKTQKNERIISKWASAGYLPFPVIIQSRMERQKSSEPRSAGMYPLYPGIHFSFMIIYIYTYKTTCYCSPLPQACSQHPRYKGCWMAR